jgi:hypothetical protein
MSTRLGIFRRPNLKVRKLRSDSHLLRSIKLAPPQDLVLNEALTNLKVQGTPTRFRIRKHLILPLRKYDGTYPKFSQPVNVARARGLCVQKAPTEPGTDSTSTEIRIRKHTSSKGKEYDATRPKISQRTNRTQPQDIVLQESPTGLKGHGTSTEFRIRKYTNLKRGSIYIAPEKQRAHENSNTITITKHASLKGSAKPFALRRLEGQLTVQKEPSEPTAPPEPITIRRLPNLVIQKVPTEPIAVEPPVKAELPLSFKIKEHRSLSWYMIPTRDTTNLWKAIAEPSVDPVEVVHPPNLDDENPSKRVERIIESAHAKRIHREAWDARRGLLTLTISLLFSARSQGRIEELIKKYNPKREKRRWFDLANRLDVDKYAKYEDMLNGLLARWKPFRIQVNTPGRRLQNTLFRVGVQLASENLEPLEKDLVRGLRKLHNSGQVHKMMRSREQLSMMVINGDITEFEEALQLLQQLKQEYQKGIEDIRVEGLVLHGRQGAVDTLFPPPKVFLFSGGEAADQESGTVAPVAAVT